MRTAILDPFSGISGDMTLGALVALGLDQEWLRALPARMGLPDVRVDIREVLRGEIVCWKVDFDIPPQPHGPGVRQQRQLPRIRYAHLSYARQLQPRLHRVPRRQVRLGRPLPVRLLSHREQDARRLGAVVGHRHAEQAGFILRVQSGRRRRHDQPGGALPHD
jgi:hypothetical protein